MKLVRVWTDVGSEKNVSLVARIIETNGPLFTIQFLSPTENKNKHGCTIYKYEDETYQIDDDSITHYLDTSDEGDIGFVSIGEGEWIRTSDESDEDYIPSEEDSDDDEEDEEDLEDEDVDDEEFEEDIDDVEDDYGDE
jgi:ribonuclease E